MLKKIICCCLICFSPLCLLAQATSDYAVQVTAVTQASPPTVTLHWLNDFNATQYIINRKAKDAISWGSTLANLSGTANQYTDNNVAADSAYEYRVLKVTASYN